MTDKITRCPKCSTAFRVSDVHLQSAKGVVRCGSCLNIFDARENMEAPKSSAAQIAPKENQHQTPSSEPKSAAESPQKPNDAQAENTPSAQPDSARETKNLTFTKSPNKSDTDNYSFDDDIITDDEHYSPPPKELAKPTSPLKEEEEEQDPEDESWALDLLKDDSEPDIQFKKVVPAKPTSTEDNYGARSESSLHFEPESSLTEEAQDEEPATEFSSIKDSGNAGVDDSGDTDVDDSTDTVVVDSSLNNDVSSNTKPPKPESAIKNSTESAALAEKPEAPLPNKEKQTLSQHSKGGAADDNIRELLAGIEPDPLEVDWEGEKEPLYKRLMWPSLCLFALLALITQIAWLEFDRLSKMEPYRGLYAHICPIVGCKLPEMRDLQEIKASNLIVRTHPDVENALQVDVILQNNAAFQQRFPSLTLTFSNIEEKAVASRTFVPKEYLGGELSGSNLMPMDTPIHIAMELMDPGPEAVSYSIAISD